MTFIDDLKERIRQHREGSDDRYDIADEIRENPKYAPVVEKLRVLTAERDELLRILYKVEIDIDACLVVISIGREKEEIDSKR